jgi:protein-glutamine gamma-glutamyltransferase
MRFSKWRWSADKTFLVNSIKWLALPLIGSLGWTVFRKQKRKVNKRKQSETKLSEDHSEFDLIEKKLIELGFERKQGEALLHWIYRIKKTSPVFPLEGIVKSILPMHYRDRFDPNGLREEDRMKMRTEVDKWLKTLELSANP